jgi:CDP-glucose 4,6-dehydratase
MSKNFWKNKRILITGHTGFKGSWLALLLNQLGANVYGLSDEKKEGIYEIVEKSQFLIKEYFENINNIDNENAEKILGEIEPDIVFHFAAQSLVYKGYLYPKDTINTNILGTYNILDYVDKLTSAKTITVATTDKGLYKTTNK